MANIREISEIAGKWARVTPGRVADYEAGIRAPRADWAQQTLAAVPAWEAGIQQAVAQKSFGKGVSRAGTSKWQENSLSKGTARWGPGVTLGEAAYAAGFGPFRDAIARVTLPPRRARRDPSNLLRVAAIVQALVKVKEAQGS